MGQPPQREGLPVTGGGALLDLGSYAVNQALHFFGPVRSFYAELRLAPGDDGFDEGFFVALRHDGGMTWHVTGNSARQGDVGSRFRVDGAAATVVVPDDDGQTARLTAGRTPESEGAAWGTIPESRWCSIHRGGVAVPVPPQRGDRSAFYTGFARAVRGDGPPPVDPWDAAALEVLDAARISAVTRQVVVPGTAGRDEGIENRSGHPPSRPTPFQRDHPLMPATPALRRQPVGGLPRAGFAETRTSAGNRPHESASEFTALSVTRSNGVEKSVNDAVRAVAGGT